MKKIKLLIIEDDEKVLEELYNFLSEKNIYDIRKSSHGEEGLTLINIFRPDLIILDVMLPEIDGFEICKRIVDIATNYKPKIILLTALTYLLDKMETNWVQKTGASVLLTKPVDLPKLYTYLQ